MRAREFKSDKNKLVIFDIDDTLFHTTAKINVVDKETSKVLRSLTNQEFNNYKLQPGEDFDFGEFRDAEKFDRESLPIDPMLDQLRSDYSAGHDVRMLTARSDFNSQPLVAKKFKEHGIDINKVHLYRAGNLAGDAPPATKKAKFVYDWLKSGKFDSVVMYDDSTSNLRAFKNLQQYFPDVNFEAHHVSEEGATTQIEEEINRKNKEQFVEIFKKFLPLAVKIIGLKRLPEFEFLSKLDHPTQPTFGMYVNDENKMYVALANRHPNDILRTIAHELTHFKQDTEHKLNDKSGRTGSPEENEANAVAGIVMRHFNKTYPEFLKVKPVVLEKWSMKYKKSINCSNPKGFSQRAHCQGRKKNEDVEQDPGEPLPFPKGTTVVDVSDPYDWYKLGMVISDLDDANPAIFGKGSPSTVVAFGSEEEEHALLPYLKRLGLRLHDIDRPEDVKKAIPAKAFIDKMQENFADGKNPGRKGLAKRSGVNCKQPVSKLRSIAKNSSGERQRMAHWCANMKSGKQKANEGSVEDLEKDLKNPYSWDAIDHMMTTIAKRHNITPKQLHDKFVEKHGKIPDVWIRKKK